MRAWRASGKEKPLTPEARRKRNARARVQMMQKRGTMGPNGKITPQPCEDCGSTENVEKHHEDYSKPLKIVWLCRGCHRRRHIERPQIEVM